MNRQDFVSLTTLFLSCALLAAPAQTGGYSVIKKIPIPGSG